MEPKPSPRRVQQGQVTSESQQVPTQNQQGQVAEFGGVEEMFRADCAQHPVPEQVRERLKESISREPTPATPWWKKLFKG